MLVRLVQFSFAAEDGATAESLFAELQAASRAEAGVVAFSVARSVDDPSRFVLWEVYENQAAFDFHSASVHYRRLVVDGVRKLAKERTGELLSPV
ncbi:MAG TPA: putative quinol monooxygenase [Candidatus Cybelea sp.]